MNKNRLIFVYNADGGLFNTATDIAHKILSPDTYSCDLCALTHGYFSVRKNWVSFLDTLPLECDFLHRDEFRGKYTDQLDELPAVFLIKDERLELLLSAQDIKQCETLDQLKQQITQNLPQRQ
jgi:hypothetical protein